MSSPLGRLRFLYVGTGDFERDLAYYRDVVGAEVVWNFRAFGARVAALGAFDGALLLIADHRPAPGCMPVCEVVDLDAATRDLGARGWRPKGERFEIPNGPCFVFEDPSGNPFAIFQDERPDAMEEAYADPGNPRAVREP